MFLEKKCNRINKPQLIEGVIMYLLTYKQQDGYPVNLVFDSENEAEYWGLIYSMQNNNSVYTVTQQDK